MNTLQKRQQLQNQQQDGGYQLQQHSPQVQQKHNHTTDDLTNYLSSKYNSNNNNHLLKTASAVVVAQQSSNLSNKHVLSERRNSMISTYSQPPQMSPNKHHPQQSRPDFDYNSGKLSPSLSYHYHHQSQMVHYDENGKISRTNHFDHTNTASTGTMTLPQQQKLFKASQLISEQDIIVMRRHHHSSPYLLQPQQIHQQPDDNRYSQSISPPPLPPPPPARSPGCFYDPNKIHAKSIDASQKYDDTPYNQQLEYFYELQQQADMRLINNGKENYFINLPTSPQHSPLLALAAAVSQSSNHQSTYLPRPQHQQQLSPHDVTTSTGGSVAHTEQTNALLIAGQQKPHIQQGLGGYWMTLANNERIWCAVDSR